MKRFHCFGIQIQHAAGTTNRRNMKPWISGLKWGIGGRNFTSWVMDPAAEDMRKCQKMKAWISCLVAILVIEWLWRKRISRFDLGSSHGGYAKTPLGLKKLILCGILQVQIEYQLELLFKSKLKVGIPVLLHHDKGCDWFCSSTWAVGVVGFCRQSRKDLIIVLNFGSSHSGCYILFRIQYTVDVMTHQEVMKPSSPWGKIEPH